MSWPAKHFTLDELTRSDTALRLGIDNRPRGDAHAHLTQTALKMDAVREHLGQPVHVSSGYRCVKLNRTIGGSATSAHCLGYAVDFTCPDFGTPLQVAEAIRDSGLRFDQLIFEGTWVHISFDPRLRQQCLTARFHPGRATTYQAGLHDG